jgi:hypothetical protein
MRRWTAAILPTLLGAVWLLSLFLPLLSPGRALANRDIAVFHLPLRTSFRDLAEFGLPMWNPWLHGGQPILSNPSYGSFYPPSWLIFAAPPHYALSLMVLLHAAIAFAGAWRLARHFGCGRGVAALAAVGYVGCGAYLTLLSAYTLFGSMAWFPWVVAWGDAALREPEGRRWWRPALLAGGALGMQLLNGEPSTVVMSGLALLALAASAAFRRPATLLRVLVPPLFALALAAVQIVPTVARLADSPRRGISASDAMLWSLPPQRAVELVFPRFFGDPARNDVGLFFSWKLHDRDYPYIESLYPGLLLTVLGVSALLLWKIPRRAAWMLCLAGGCLLALGRHTPVYEVIREVVPMVAILRFPEKFVLLSILALATAGVLGWQRLLAEREAGRPQAADLPLALALVALATALTLAFLLVWEPRAAAWMIYVHGSPALTPAGRGVALGYLRGEAWIAVAGAAGVSLLLALCRWPRPPRRLLEGLAVLLLAADLWYYGHGLLRTLPADAYLTPSPVAATLLPVRDRLFVEEMSEGRADVMRRGDPRTLFAGAALDRLEPYSGLIWGIPYGFNTDFELMLTGWGQKAQSIVAREAKQPQMVYRYLGIWNVGTILRRKTLQEQAAALRDPAGLPVHRIVNTYVLPRFRFVPRVRFHAGHAEALAAARAAGWRVAREEQCVGPPGAVRYLRPPRALEVADEGRRIELRYRAEEGGAFFVAAMTYDRGWQALLDGKAVTTYPTAACQLGVRLPAGEHRLVLRYREPFLGLGAALSVAALAAGAAALIGLRRGRGE